MWELQGLLNDVMRRGKYYKETIGKKSTLFKYEALKMLLPNATVDIVWYIFIIFTVIWHGIV